MGHCAFPRKICPEAVANPAANLQPRYFEIRSMGKVREDKARLRPNHKNVLWVICCFSIPSNGIILPWTKKKRTIIEIRGEKNAVPRVISCSIRRDQRRASPIRDCPRLLPCADGAWSSMISHLEQRSSRRESRGWFFFFVQGSMTADGILVTTPTHSCFYFWERKQDGEENRNKRNDERKRERELEVWSKCTSSVSDWLSSATRLWPGSSPKNNPSE